MNQTPSILLAWLLLQMKLLWKWYRDVAGGFYLVATKPKLLLRRTHVSELALQTNGLMFCQFLGITCCLGNTMIITKETTPHGAVMIGLCP